VDGELEPEQIITIPCGPVRAKLQKKWRNPTTYVPYEVERYGVSTSDRSLAHLMQVDTTAMDFDNPEEFLDWGDDPLAAAARVDENGLVIPAHYTDL